jgi:DNA-binding PadR family transcriptional regulator
MRGHRNHPGHPRTHDPDAVHERHAYRHRGFDRDFEREFGRGWPGPGRGWGGFESRRRASRGDVRAAILALLAEAPMHGYQIIQELTERTQGAWSPSPGSVYPALQLLQDEGLVSAAETDGKRVFTLTDAGRAQAAERADGPAPWEAATRGSRDVGPLAEAVMQLAAAARQVGATAGQEQIEAAVQILGAARRDLYRILAGDDEKPAG